MNARKLWTSDDHEELQSPPLRNYILKDYLQKPNPLGSWIPVPDACCFAGLRMGSQFSGAATGT